MGWDNDCHVRIAQALQAYFAKQRFARLPQASIILLVKVVIIRGIAPQLSIQLLMRTG